MVFLSLHFVLHGLNSENPCDLLSGKFHSETLG